MPAVAPVLVTATPTVSGREVHIPASLAARLGLTEGGELHLTAGSVRQSAHAVIGSELPADGPAELRIHPEFLHRLRIPNGIHLHARWDAATRTVSLGPFVGIMALRSVRGPRYGEHEPFFRSLTRVGQRLGIATYMFGPRDVDWQRRQVYGYAYVGKWPAGRWRRSVYPLPDVVYDRVQTRRAEYSPKFAAFRERLARSVPAWFNQTGFFDKWRMHVELSKNERLRKYLPDTALYRGPADLERFIHSYGTAYLKPVGGSLGLGIIRVHRSAHVYVAAHQPGETLLIHRAAGISGLAQIVHKLTRRGTYVIQQGLPLARWRGRLFDIRILMQRTTGGAWALTKIFSRIAPPGRFTANLSRGGEGCRIDLLLRRVYGRHHAALLRNLHAAGMEMAKEIEHTVPGIVGELGLDLGLDRRGRIWLIEVNSKPFLQMTREAGSARTLSLSVQRPLRFAKFLAGYDEGPEAGSSGSSRFPASTDERDEERTPHAQSRARHFNDVS